MDLNEIKKTFKEYLHSMKLRYTPEREEVINEIFSKDDHFDADELFLKLKMRNSRVSRATVYRCLNLLESCSLVNKSSFGERHSHYEQVYNRKHHDHLICTECGNVVEFYDDVIEKRQKTICSAHHFTLTNHKLQIFGVCPKCSEKN